VRAGGTAHAKVAIPHGYRALRGFMDVPLDQDSASSWALDSEEKVGDLHGPDVSRISKAGWCQ
jgi:hypothetical protein